MVLSRPHHLVCFVEDLNSLFHKMVSCLIEVDSTDSAIYDGIAQCMLQYKGSSYQFHLDLEVIVLLSSLENL
jgi:hypothetical protein